MLQYVWLTPLGFVVGAYGTLIGAGGGFILAPLLLILYPNEAPDTITSISLAVVFFNALSGTIAYARMGRVDYRSGVLFSAATAPGAVLGALTTAFIPRRAFDLVLGVVLVGTSVALLIRPEQTCPPAPKVPARGVTRRLVERDGTEHTYTFDARLGVLLSLLIGYFSSLLGIGGGIIHVPVMARVLGFPVHVATATSHFTLAVMALTGTIVHIATGAFHHGVRRTVFLAAGVVAGAQLGALLSCRLQGTWILRGLAVALGLVGVRIMLAAL